MNRMLYNRSTNIKIYTPKDRKKNRKIHEETNGAAEMGPEKPKVYKIHYVCVCICISYNI